MTLIASHTVSAAGLQPPTIRVAVHESHGFREPPPAARFPSFSLPLFDYVRHEFCSLLWGSNEKRGKESREEGREIERRKFASGQELFETRRLMEVGGRGYARSKTEAL